MHTKSSAVSKVGVLRIWLSGALLLFCIALPRTVYASSCVTVDEQRDGLGPTERRSAQTLFEDVLAENGVTVVRSDCSETWTIYHVRLGRSISVSVQSPRGQRHERVRRIEDLPGIYDQMVRSILTHTDGTGDSFAVDRDNVTDTQTTNNRVAADAIWYGRLGYGAGFPESYRGGTAFGFGRRWELDRVGLDLSFLNLALYQNSEGADGVSASWLKFELHYFFNAHANHTPYLGGGLSLGSNSLPAAGGEYNGFGLQGELSVGYEMLRASTLRVFAQLDATLPMYRASRVSALNTDSSEREFVYAPTVTLALGLGWGTPRKVVTVQEL